MRKLILTTAAVASAIVGAFAAEPSFGTLTDTRDGQTYKTVKIGEQTWMAQNINYKTDSSWCYNDSLSYCKKYGRLYDWKTATTVCPKGWKLPSREDWIRLVATAGGKEIAGKKLKARSGWNNNGNGTDDFGFSALPSGYRYLNGGFLDVGDYGYWYAAMEYGSYFAYSRNMYYLYDYAYEYSNFKDDGYSVRCVADSP